MNQSNRVFRRFCSVIGNRKTFCRRIQVDTMFDEIKLLLLWSNCAHTEAIFVCHPTLSCYVSCRPKVLQMSFHSVGSCPCCHWQLLPSSPDWPQDQPKSQQGLDGHFCRNCRGDCSRFHLKLLQNKCLAILIACSRNCLSLELGPQIALKIAQSCCKKCVDRSWWIGRKLLQRLRIGPSDCFKIVWECLKNVFRSIAANVLTCRRRRFWQLWVGLDVSSCRRKCSGCFKDAWRVAQGGWKCLKVFEGV